MKLTTGYKKPIDSDGSVLLAGGGHKTIQQIINDYGALSITPAVSFSSPISGNLLGNASTADRLKNPVTINGVSFDGSGNITISASANGGNADTVDNLHASSFVQTSGDQTVGGIKTFSGSSIYIKNEANGIHQNIIELKGGSYGDSSVNRGGRLELFGITANATAANAGTKEAKVQLYVDGEGGNLRLQSPTNNSDANYYYYSNATGTKATNFWEMDSYNGNLRFYTYNLNGNATTKSGTTTPLILKRDGKIYGNLVGDVTGSATTAANGIYYVSDGALTTSIAAWVASKAYAVDDVVIANNIVYKCKTAHTSGSSFSTTNWSTNTCNLKASNTTIPSLVVGTTIAFKLPYQGGSSVTLNLTTAAGASGAKTIRRNQANVTTHYPKDTILHMTYDGTYWNIMDYDSNTTYTAMIEGYCNTAADTAAKVVTSTNFGNLTTGAVLKVRFTVANTKNTALTLNVNSTGAKTIAINGTVSSASNYTLPAGTYFCYYDGTYWDVRTDGNLRAKAFIGNASTATDLYIREYSSADGTYYPMWANGTGGANRSIYITQNNLQFLPKTGRLSAQQLSVGITSGSRCCLQYDSTNKCVNFVFD